jgi:hypothetical protein
MFCPDKILTDIVQSGDKWREALSPEKANFYGDELARIIGENSD